MKNKLLLLLLIASLFACKPEESIPDKHNYNYLTAEQLFKTPYFTNPAFDTLSFVSNQNDTVVFAKTRVDSGWYREIDFNPGVEYTSYRYYQQISANYQTIKGEGSFGVVHCKKGHTFNSIASDFVKFSYNDYNFYLNDRFLGINHKVIIDSMLLNNKKYYQVTEFFNNWVDSISVRAYINIDYGVFHILENKNSKNWILIH
jgi:hypothetical protein